MANDGNVVLTAGGTTASVVTRANASVGAGSLSLIASVLGDDTYIETTLPFPVVFNGVSYTVVGVGSNGYVTFGAGSGAYFAAGPTSPPLPAILVGAGDRAYRRVYAGSVDGNATFCVRFEGYNTPAVDPASAATVTWEVKFTAAEPSKFLLDIDLLVSTTASGISDGVGPTYLAEYTAAANSGYTISFSSGANFAVSGTMVESPPPTFSTSWRIMWEDSELSATPGAVAIRELQFREVVGVAQLFSGGTASASDTRGSFVAANAADNNVSTYWESNNPATWQYDFASAKKIRQYTITANGDFSTGGKAPTAFRLQYYDVGTTTWVTVDIRSGVTGWGANETRTFDVIYDAATSGNVTLPLYSAAGTGSNPTVNAGAITLPSLLVDGGGGPSGKFGNVVLPFFDVTGQYDLPAIAIDGDANLGALDLGVYGTPWQLYGLVFGAPVPNAYNGDCVLFDLTSANVLSVDGRIDPPLALPYYSVDGYSFNGSVSYADILINVEVNGYALAGASSDGNVWLPVFDAAGDVGNNGDSTVPPFAVAGVSVAGASVYGGALLESYDVAGTAYSSTTSAGAVVLPVFVVTSAVDSSSVINGAAVMPAVSAKGNMLSGQSIAGMIQVPLISVSARGYSSVVGSASVKIPALHVDGWMVSIPAALTAADFKTIVMNSRTKAVSTYENLAANSLCEFNGVVLAATAGGIVALTGEKDGTADIDAFIQSSVSQYGTQFFKRIINGYIGYRADGNLRVTLFTDEHREYSYPLAPRQVATIHPSKVKFGRGVEGRYWQWKIANVAGAGFEIDAYEMDVDVLTRRI